MSKILEILIAENDGPDDPDYGKYTQAREHFDFNIGGGYVGERTPVYVEDEFLHDLTSEA